MGALFWAVLRKGKVSRLRRVRLGGDSASLEMTKQRAESIFDNLAGGKRPCPSVDEEGRGGRSVCEIDGIHKERIFGWLISGRHGGMCGCEVGEGRGWGGGRAWGEAELPASPKRGRAGGWRREIRRCWQSRWELGRTRSLTRKQRGEKAEPAFLAKAADLGFRLAKPWARVRGTTWLWLRGRG